MWVTRPERPKGANDEVKQVRQLEVEAQQAPRLHMFPFQMFLICCFPREARDVFLVPDSSTNTTTSTTTNTTHQQRPLSGRVPQESQHSSLGKE